MDRRGPRRALRLPHRSPGLGGRRLTEPAGLSGPGPRGVEAGLVRLRSAKEVFARASLRAAERIRSCEGCDARCCRAGLNSMRLYRIEAVALARRLSDPDLAPLLPGILERARREVRLRRFAENPDATYDCPLLSPEGRCLVHGPAQPAGCHTYQPVADGGCDHDLPFFRKHSPAIRAAERRAFGKESPPLPIPEALLRAFRGLRPSRPGRGRRGGPA